jgi:MtN3 and saliva related transmembrane protein
LLHYLSSQNKNRFSLYQSIFFYRRTSRELKKAEHNFSLTQYYNNLYWLKICKTAGMDWTQVIGLTAGVCTATSLIPQVVKTIKEKKAEDVSLVMLLVLGTGIILWVVYGIRKNDLPIIATNAFSLLVNITMVILGIRYKKKP